MESENIDGRVFLRVTNCMLKVVTEFVNEVIHFFEEIVANGLTIDGSISCIDFPEIFVNLIFGDIRVDFDEIKTVDKEA